MQNDPSVTYTNTASNDSSRDNELWLIAKRRAAFKMSIFSYAAVNLLLIAIWYFTTGTGSYFWPKWPLLGWGVGIVTQYVHAYYGNDIFSAQKEYEKLKNKQ